MKSFVVLALGATALAAPQAAAPPAGCQASVSGTFQIQTVLAPTKRDLESRQLAGALTLTLQNGILKDQAGRTGYIASNFQFQFDAPVQAGARETSGFSLCSNGSLALSGSRPYGAAVWWQCNSGGFFNLYSTTIGNQCQPIFITAVNRGGSQASQIPDGQPQASSARPAVSQISDGQPQASSARVPAVTQISDGQPQAPSARPPVVTQISDGQPQAPAATTRAPVVSQISDGQPQARPASSVRAVVSQISDGQPQARPASSATRVISQISDGQPQAPAATANATVSRPAPSQFTGAAATGSAAAGALAAGLFGLFAFL